MGHLSQHGILLHHVIDLHDVAISLPSGIHPWCMYYKMVADPNLNVF